MLGKIETEIPFGSLVSMSISSLKSVVPASLVALMRNLYFVSGVKPLIIYSFSRLYSLTAAEKVLGLSSSKLLSL